MWVDDEVWTDALLGEWHVLLPVSHPDRSFLAVTGGKLVTNLWNANRAHLNLGVAVAIFVGCDDDLLNHAVLRVLQLR